VVNNKSFSPSFSTIISARKSTRISAIFSTIFLKSFFFSFLFRHILYYVLLYNVYVAPFHFQRIYHILHIWEFFLPSNLSFQIFLLSIFLLLLSISPFFLYLYLSASLLIFPLLNYNRPLAK
jgi:hypothetical protein